MSKRQDKNFPKSDPERHKIPSFPASSSKPKVTVIIDVNANKRQGKVGEDCAKRPGSESLRKKEAVYFEYFKNRPLEGGTYEKDTIYGKIDIGTPMESRTWTSYYPYSSAASDSKAKSQATYPVQTLTEKIEKTGKPQNPQNPTHIQKGPSNFRYEPPNLSFVRADSFFQKITGRPTEGDPDPRTRDLKKLISQNPWEKSLSTDEKGLPLSDAECERNVRARFEAMEKDFAKFRDRKEPRITDPVPPKPEKYEKLNPIADKDPFLYAKEQRLEDERKTQERVNSMLSDINLKFERPFFPHKVEPVKNLVQENKPEGKETDFGEKVLRALEGLRKEDPRKASGLDTYAKEKGFGALVGSVADYMEETREPFPFRDIIKARKAYGRESLWNASAGDVSFALLKIAERLSPAAKGLGIIGGVLSAKEGLEILDKSNKLLEEKSGLDPKSSIRINALSECDDPYTAKFLSDSFSTQAEKAKLERASSIFKYMEEDPNANRPKKGRKFLAKLKIF